MKSLSFWLATLILFQGSMGFATSQSDFFKKPSNHWYPELIRNYERAFVPSKFSHGAGSGATLSENTLNTMVQTLISRHPVAANIQASDLKECFLNIDNSIRLANYGYLTAAERQADHAIYSLVRIAWAAKKASSSDGKEAPENILKDIFRISLDEFSLSRGDLDKIKHVLFNSSENWPSKHNARWKRIGEVMKDSLVESVYSIGAGLGVLFVGGLALMAADMAYHFNDSNTLLGYDLQTGVAVALITEVALFHKTINIYRSWRPKRLSFISESCRAFLADLGP